MSTAVPGRHGRAEPQTAGFIPFVPTERVAESLGMEVDVPNPSTCPHRRSRSKQKVLLKRTQREGTADYLRIRRLWRRHGISQLLD